jgi:hypothetical protein
VPAQFASRGRAAEPYYVGLLKAGEVHGATYQAVMEWDMDGEGE